MKYQLDYKIRRGTIAIALLMCFICISIAGEEYFNKKTHEENIEQFRYQEESTMSYTAFLKPNMLYDTQELKSGYMFSKYVDSIEIAYSYDFDSNEAIDVILEGKLNVELEGFTGSDENYNSIFIKPYDSIPIKKKWNSKKGKYEDKLSINVQEYNRFVSTFFEEVKCSVDTKLNVYLDIKTVSKNEFKDIEFISKPYLTIPLNRNYFEIGGEGKVVNEDSKIDTVITEIVPSKNKIIASLVIALLSVIALILLILKTESKNLKTKRQKELAKIIKQYNSLLVGFNSELDMSNKNILYVQEIKALVRLSEEIRRPIMYRQQNDIYEIDRFYVTDDNNLYIYDIDLVYRDDKNIDDKESNNQLNSNVE